MEYLNKLNRRKEESDNNKSKCELENIKTDYFLRTLFNNISKKKLLEIIKYNNKTKGKLDLNINEYKKYCETYSSIEVEIIPCQNKYGKFINIKDEEKSFFHIFFNNSKDQIRRNNLNEDDKVTKINIVIDYQVKSFEELFSECICIESIYFKKFYRNNINNMFRMFYECSSLKELNLSNFKTDNVTNMYGMFCGCSALREIDISTFTTNKVTDMVEMFFGCSNLKELNLSNFNTENINNICFMFYGCSSLLKLDLSNFNTDKVDDMRGMFTNCSSLKEINISNFNTELVTDMSGMFLGCSEEIQNQARTQLKNISEWAFEGF